MVRAEPPRPDPELPRARELLLPGPSSAVLSRFLERGGRSLEDSRPVQVTYWPGSSCTVRYRVRVRDSGGRTRSLTLCAETRGSLRRPVEPPADFGTRFGIDPVTAEDGLLVWAYPYDPVLPGLPEAATGSSVRAATRLPAPTAVSVRPLRYRPTRRAVFRYRVVGPGAERQILFGKVLRAGAFDRTFDAYRNFGRTNIRLARPEAADGIEGLALFPYLPGTSVSDRLVAGARLPSPARMAGLVSRLAEVRWPDEPRARRYGRAARSTGRLLSHLLPHRAQEVEELASLLANHADAVTPGPVVHGDLYEAQVLVDDDFRLGLIDLEDAGPGDPLLDGANMLAHLVVLNAYRPRAARRPLAYRSLLRRHLMEATGASEADLAWRESLCALLLATSPFRIQSPDWPRRVEAGLNRSLRLVPEAA